MPADSRTDLATKTDLAELKATTKADLAELRASMKIALTVFDLARIQWRIAPL